MTAIAALSEQWLLQRTARLSGIAQTLYHRSLGKYWRGLHADAKVAIAIEWFIRVPVTSRLGMIALGLRADDMEAEVKLDVRSSAGRTKYYFAIAIIM